MTPAQKKQALLGNAGSTNWGTMPSSARQALQNAGVQYGSNVRQFTGGTAETGLLSKMGRSPTGSAYGATWGTGAAGGGAGGPGGAFGGGAGAGGGAGGMNYQGLINSWQGQMDAANAANRARQGQIEGGYDSLYSDVMGKLQGMGDTEKAKRAREFRDAAEAQKVDMTQRGLANASGALISADTAANRENAVAQGAIDESVRGQQAGAMQNIRGNKLNFQERINEIGPDYNSMLSLLNQAGKGAGSMEAYGAGLGAAGGGGVSFGGSGGVQMGGNAALFGVDASGKPLQNPLNTTRAQDVFGPTYMSQAQRTDAQGKPILNPTISKYQPIRGSIYGKSTPVVSPAWTPFAPGVSKADAFAKLPNSIWFGGR